MGSRFSRRSPSGVLEKELESFPLHCSALRGDNVSLRAALLLDNRAIGTPDMLGLSPLHYAAAFGSVPCVDLLLQEGGTPDVLDRCGNSACHLAALLGHGAVLAVLIEHANQPLTARNHCGLNVLDCADVAMQLAWGAETREGRCSLEMMNRMPGLCDIPDEWISRNLIQMAPRGTAPSRAHLERCWECNQLIESHCRAPWLAAQAGSLTQIQDLVAEGGFDLDAQDPYGHRNGSCLPQECPSVEALERHTGHGLTVLHIAVSCGHSELAVRLLELGASAWRIDQYNGNTALHLALRHIQEPQARLTTINVLLNR